MGSTPFGDTFGDIVIQAVTPTIESLPINTDFIFENYPIKFSPAARYLISLEYMRNGRRDLLQLIRNCNIDTLNYLHLTFLLTDEPKWPGSIQHNDIQIVSGTLRHFYELVIYAGPNRPAEYYNFITYLYMYLCNEGLMELFYSYKKVMVSKTTFYVTR